MSTAAAAVAGPTRARLPLVIPVAVLLAWLLIAAGEATGNSGLVHHDAIIEGEVPAWIGVLLFLVAWQLMIAAMMLPTSVSMLQHYAGVVERQHAPGRSLGEFVGGYALVWTVFGAAALVGDIGVHTIVDRTPWLEAHEYVIAGGTLAIAGVVQFTPLTYRCLTQCRQPFAYLVHQRLRGVSSPFRLGVGHGLFCLGCCWGLMLVMFAAGAASLPWMAGLGAVMLYEKVGRHGRGFAPVVGVVLLVWATLVFAHPSWLPDALSGFA